MDTIHNDFSELEEMKQQMALLRSKLDSQQLVNGQLMRRAMQQRYSWLDHHRRIWTVISLLMIPYYIYMFRTMMNISLLFLVYTIIFLLTCFAIMFFTRGMLRSEHFLTESMRQVSERILRQKRLDRMWKFTGWPALAVWIVWLFLELSCSSGIFEMTPMLWGAVTGVLVGLTCGGIYMHKYNKTIRDMEEQIKAFVEENGNEDNE